MQKYWIIPLQYSIYTSSCPSDYWIISNHTQIFKSTYSFVVFFREKKKKFVKKLHSHPLKSSSQPQCWWQIYRVCLHYFGQIFLDHEGLQFLMDSSFWCTTQPLCYPSGIKQNMFRLVNTQPAFNMATKICIIWNFTCIISAMLGCLVLCCVCTCTFNFWIIKITNNFKCWVNQNGKEWFTLYSYSTNSRPPLLPPRNPPLKPGGAPRGGPKEPLLMARPLPPRKPMPPRLPLKPPRPRLCLSGMPKVSEFILLSSAQVCLLGNPEPPDRSAAFL